MNRGGSSLLEPAKGSQCTSTKGMKMGIKCGSLGCPLGVFCFRGSFYLLVGLGFELRAVRLELQTFFFFFWQYWGLNSGLCNQ
jgi:hypothetical protein